MDDFPVAPARQVEMACEHVARVVAAVRRLAIALRPPLIGAISRSRLTMRAAVIRSWTSSELPGVVIAIAVAIAESLPMSRLLPVIVALASLVVAIARVVAPPHIVKHLALPQMLKLGTADPAVDRDRCADELEQMC